MVQVRVREGILEGQEVENEFGGKFYSFKGVPYAQPPVGELRFKAPQPLKPWDGVRSATEHGPICYQDDIFLKTGKSGSEDCLYLNIYTPAIKPTKPLPVMFFIHGGGFVCGYGNDDLYGPEFLVREDVILVTINYRLEILGFLCLDIEDVPGNAGIKDQVAALRWVRDNISNFGGDPNNVTIFGESAGGACVWYHLVSPMSKGLFKRAIAQSGAATSSWASTFEPYERAKALAKQLGCESEDGKEIYEFLKCQPMEVLVNVKAPITLSETVRAGTNLYFSIVSEKQFGDNERFFYGDIYDVLRNGVHEGVEIMSGFCADEGIVCLAAGANLEEILTQTDAFPEVLTPGEITRNCPISTVLEVGKKTKKHYFGKQKVSMETVEQYVKYLGDAMFNYGIVQAEKISSRTNKVYLYEFSTQTERNWFANIIHIGDLLNNRPTVSHADDLAYLFPLKALSLVTNQKIDKDSKTFELINNITKLWTNFAKYGNPTPDSSLGATWEPYDEKDQKYMEISNTFTLRAKPLKEDIEFWEGIFREYLPNYEASMSKL
ncbi:juvenile hormone esterase-like [Pectinophora gossypiella]|uniref:juvenile hormone esterase-like n=1 Tax=Pectinophora gossypiella TaxID=13191 RepID=UPI00214DF267|nr:juvenile hormone esterase-like [Pectinophora gossypiella]